MLFSLLAGLEAAVCERKIESSKERGNIKTEMKCGDVN
jgi:hypothetical protein